MKAQQNVYFVRTGVEANSHPVARRATSRNFDSMSAARCERVADLRRQSLRKLNRTADCRVIGETCRARIESVRQPPDPESLCPRRPGHGRARTLSTEHPHNRLRAFPFLARCPKAKQHGD